MPFFYPIVVDQLGFDPVWFGILCNKLIEIGLLTPPVGMNVYVLAGVVPDVSVVDIFRSVSWFILFEFVATGILIAFPILTTWLPSMMIT
jgi:TRAP-type C4-dicarboxylate transport system permease large subunit